MSSLRMEPGLSEKWLWSSQQWMYITPDGSLYSTLSGKVAEATRLATLDNQHYVNLDLLTSPPAAHQARVRFSAFNGQQELNVPLIPDYAQILDALFEDWSDPGL